MKIPNFLLPDRASATSDLELLRKGGVSFLWGEVQTIHDIGEITVVEYLDHSDGFLAYHLYVRGKNTNTGYTSFDRALLGGIAFKNSPNPNDARHGAAFAATMLGLPDVKATLNLTSDVTENVQDKGEEWVSVRSIAESGEWVKVAKLLSNPAVTKAGYALGDSREGLHRDTACVVIKAALAEALVLQKK